MTALLIDAHCHLERDTFAEELEAVIERAWDAGLSHMVAIGASRASEGAREAVALAERHERIFAAIGLHPHEARLANPHHEQVIDGLLSHPKVVALGEIGLDYYYDYSPQQVQRELFERMLRMAREHNVPAMLHVRDALDDCLAILDSVGLPERGGVVHCFTGGPEQARAYLDRGLHLSIPGVVTFKKAEELREAVRMAPIDRLLVETDTPYLAPVPHRGKRNEPAFVRDTLARVAELKGLSVADAAQCTGENSLALFGI